MVPVFCWITLVARCLCNQAAVAETEGARGKHRGKQMKCPSPTWSLDFKRDEHSQSGEDGSLANSSATRPPGRACCAGYWLTGYELVCVLPWNAFFVKKQYYPLFKMETNDPQVLRTDLSGITYLFVGYDGKVLLRGACKLPWHHGVKFKESNFQILPRFLRRYPESYTRYQSFLFELFLLLKKPGRLAEVLRERFCCRPKRRA